MPGKNAYCQLPRPAGPNQRRRGRSRQPPRPGRGGIRSQSSIPVRTASDGGQRQAGDSARVRPLLRRSGPADEVYVGLDLLNHDERNDKRSVAPDVFIARGGPKRGQDTDKVWEER